MINRRFKIQLHYKINTSIFVLEDHYHGRIEKKRKEKKKKKERAKDLTISLSGRAAHNKRTFCPIKFFLFFNKSPKLGFGKPFSQTRIFWQKTSSIRCGKLHTYIYIKKKLLFNLYIIKKFIN